MQVKIRIFRPTEDNPFENYQDILVEVANENSVDDLIEIVCANECKINLLDVALFGIWDATKERWLVPSQKIKELISSSKLQLRMRFVFKLQNDFVCPRRTVCRMDMGDNKKSSVAQAASVKYHYFQCREDFINDKYIIADQTTQILKSVDLEMVLDVARLDLIILHKNYCCKSGASKNIKKYMNLIPKSFAKQISSTSFLNRKVIKHKFYQLFEGEIKSKKFDTHSQTSLYKMYSSRLELLSGSILLKEEFITLDNTHIVISGDEGIKIGKEITYDFSALVDLKLERDAQNGIVSLSFLDGVSKMLQFEFYDVAMTLVSCIEGYFRLVVDPHHILCSEIAAPRLQKQLQSGIFGPITFKEVETRLREFECGYWLIRRSWENCDDYFLNVLDTETFHIAKCKISLSEGKYWVEKHGFKNIYCFLDFYLDNDFLDKNKQVYPNKSIKSKLLVSRPKENPTYVENASIKIIPCNDLEFVRKLGTGEFSVSLLYEHKKKPNSKLVFKKHVKPTDCTDSGEVSFYSKLFNESMSQLSRIKHPNHVKLIGTATNMQNYFAIEYCPGGAITTYLETCVQEKNHVWFMEVMYQLSMACAYLEIHNIVHGQICGKNVFLYTNNPLCVKLGDSGILQRRPTKDHGKIPVLKYPWLPQDFINNFHLNSTFTIDEDKWSFATTVCEILCCPYPNLKLSNKLMEIENAFSKIRLQDVHYESLFVTLKSCWSLNKQQRPSFRSLVREIGLVFKATSREVSDSVEFRPTTSNPCPLRYYNDDFLVNGEEIGNGNFGEVKKYIYHTATDGDELIAIKTLKHEYIQAITHNDEEIEKMIGLEHKYIVHLKGITVPSYSIVMEFLPYGSLRSKITNQHCINKKMKFQTKDLIEFCWQIADALAYLHSQNIVHRDIALRNILLDKDKNTGRFYAKVSDFGLSRHLKNRDVYNEGYYTITKSNNIPFRWYAPECLKNDDRYFCSSDVWSFGITVWELFSGGKQPWHNVISYETLYSWILCGEKLDKPNTCPAKVYEVLCNECWNIVPQKRRSARELCSWFKEFNGQ